MLKLEVLNETEATLVSLMIICDSVVNVTRIKILSPQICGIINVRLFYCDETILQQFASQSHSTYIIDIISIPKKFRDTLKISRMTKLFTKGIKYSASFESTSYQTIDE